jgi:SAM-dependent methyltransferase
MDEIHDHDKHPAGYEQRPVRRRFDASRAARLDDRSRFSYLAPDALVAFVDAPRDAVVLDFGTGTGAYAIEFAQRRPDCTLLGLDIQPEMLALLHAKPAGHLVRTGGTELLAEFAGKVDRVFSINVLHELEDEHLRARASTVCVQQRTISRSLAFTSNGPRSFRISTVFSEKRARKYMTRLQGIAP